jgi:hypothetical protein
MTPALDHTTVPPETTCMIALLDLGFWLRQKRGDQIAELKRMAGLDPQAVRP